MDILSEIISRIEIPYRTTSGLPVDYRPLTDRDVVRMKLRHLCPGTDLSGLNDEHVQLAMRSGSVECLAGKFPKKK